MRGDNSIAVSYVLLPTWLCKGNNTLNTQPALLNCPLTFIYYSYSYTDLLLLLGLLHLSLYWESVLSIDYYYIGDCFSYEFNGDDDARFH